MSAFDEMFIHTCTIARNTPAVDSYGVVRPSWITVGSCIPCRIQEEIGTVRPTPNGSFYQYDARGFFDGTVDIRPQGPPTNGDQPDAIIWNAKTFLVLSVIDESGENDHWTVYLKRFAGPAVLPGSGSGVPI